MDKDCLTLYKVLPEKVRKICAIAASDLAGGSLIPDKVFPYIFSVDSAFGGYVVLLCDEKSGKAYVAVELSSGEYLLLGRIDAEIVSIKKEGGEETIYAAFRQKMLTYLYKTENVDNSVRAELVADNLIANNVFPAESRPAIVESLKDHGKTLLLLDKVASSLDTVCLVRR